MTNGVARGTRGKDVTLLLAPADPMAPPGAGAGPFAHPKYWATFVLIGDPN
jgi:CHAT domain-containing protein